MSGTESIRAASLLVREQFSGLSGDEFVRLRDAMLIAEVDRGLVDPESTRGLLGTAPIMSAERERKSAAAWNRAALVFDKDARFWRERCDQLEAGKDPGALVPAAPPARVNSHGQVVLEVVGHDRSFLWVSRNLGHCGSVHDSIGFTHANSEEDARPHEGSWVVSWAALRAAVIEIDRYQKEAGLAHASLGDLEERFQAMFATWASTPVPDGVEA